MVIPKEIIEKVNRFTINGECTKTQISHYLKVHASYLTKSFKAGEMSEDKYLKLLKFLENLDNKIADRKNLEAKLTAPIA